MTDTSKFMSIFSKIMQTKNTSCSATNKEKYNKLYSKIHSDLNSQLQKSLYPYTSDIVQKCEDMLDALESLYIFPEIIGKRCLLISNYLTTSIFKVCASLFEDKNLLILNKIYTQIPFVIINSESEDTIEILNYANVRVSLTTNEFKFLVEESSKRKIALNKIIQYFIIKTKLSKNDLCIISDNIYADAEKILYRMISRKIANIETNDVSSIEKRHLKGFSALIMSDSVLNMMRNDSNIMKWNILSYEQVDAYINSDVKQVLYGFGEEFLSIYNQIKDYYENQKAQTKKTLQNVVKDIVRLEDENDPTLRSIKKMGIDHEKKIKAEEKDLLYTLTSINELIDEICNDLNENIINGKQISRATLDDLFESIFLTKKFDNASGKQLLSRLSSFEYGNDNLIYTYVKAVSGNKVQFEAESFDHVKIENDEWEKAKMLLYIVEPENIPEDKLRNYVKILGNRCNTGKELFAKALISPERFKNRILQQSLQKGYTKAGLLLLERYEDGNEGVNLFSLANALVPEACVILADQKMVHYRNRTGFVDLYDNQFTYYKIAAAKQYLPAIGKIIDLVFESRFSGGFQIPKDNLDDDRYEEMIDHGHTICQLCQFLINKMYNVDYYREILGIVLFSLNENLSEAMSLLSKAESALAYYCKGNMYEFGGGVTINLNKAVNNYEIAIDKGLEGRVERRLEICEEKLIEYEEEEDSNEYYQSSNSYSSSETTKGYDSDGCFAPGTHILMSDGTMECVENIKVGDKVLVYDHYTGMLDEETIVANVHDASKKQEFNILCLKFENNISLSIVKSHALFDKTDNEYVWIDDSNVDMYIGHKFAFLKSNRIEEYELLNCSIERKVTNYYMPISRYHLNLFAEGILTMPPTKLTVNLFNFESNMQYNLSIVEKVGETSYEDIKTMVSYEEYSALPCKYLASVLYAKKCDMSDFEYVIKLYRDQKKYL